MTRAEQVRNLRLRMCALLLLDVVFLVCLFVASGPLSSAIPFFGSLGTYLLWMDTYTRYQALCGTEKDDK